MTLRQLARMTSGYADYVQNPDFVRALYQDPFRSFTVQDRVDLGTKAPLFYPPGTNWDYAHKNYVILGLAIEKITGRKVADLLREKVLGPLGLTQTDDPGTPAIPEPVLHAYTSERRSYLGIPDSTPFVEDSTFWNPSWTLTQGAVQTTTIDDLSATAIAMGTGGLLSPASYQAMTSTDLIGKTSAVQGCPTCAPMAVGYTYGLGLVLSGRWVEQNPLFAGEGGAFASLPGQTVGIAVVTTFLPEALVGPDAPGNEANYLWRAIGAAPGPSEAPQIPPSLK